MEYVESIKWEYVESIEWEYVWIVETMWSKKRHLRLEKFPFAPPPPVVSLHKMGKLVNE